MALTLAACRGDSTEEGLRPPHETDTVEPAVDRGTETAPPAGTDEATPAEPNTSADSAPVADAPPLGQPEGIDLPPTGPMPGVPEHGGPDATETNPENPE